MRKILGRSLLWAAVTIGFGASAAEDPPRMIVFLSNAAVELQFVQPTDTSERVFGDQRHEKHPQMWGALPIKTALVLRGLENQHAFRSIVAFGDHKFHGFAAKLTPTQVAALKGDPRIEKMMPDPIGMPASTPPPWKDSPEIPPVVPSAPPPSASTTYVRGWNLQAIGLTTASSGVTNDIYPADTTSYRNYRDGTYPVKAYLIDGALQDHVDLNYSKSTDFVNFDCNGDAHCDGRLAGPWQGYPYGVGFADCGTHATIVAGALAAKRQAPTPIGVEGVAPNAQLKSLQIGNSECSSGSRPGGAYTSAFFAAVNWMKSQVPDNGSKTINGVTHRVLSAVANVSIVWDSTSPGFGATQADRDHLKLRIRDAVWSAVDTGIFFTFATGNSNQDASDIYPGAVGYMTGGAMNVGATRHNGEPMNEIPYFSASAPLRLAKVAVYSGASASVEIWAPGQFVPTTAVYLPGAASPPRDSVNIPGLVGAWGTGSATLWDNPPIQYYSLPTGSSMAAPHVAGAALLVARKFQKAGVTLPTPAEIEAILKARRIRTASSWGHPNGDNPAEHFSDVDLLQVDDL